MQEDLQGSMSGGASRDDLNEQHVRMYNSIRQKSERDFPQGVVCSRLIDSTHCESSERKDNSFLLMCIALTCDGEFISKHELIFVQTHEKNGGTS